MTDGNSGLNLLQLLVKRVESTVSLPPSFYYYIGPSEQKHLFLVISSQRAHDLDRRHTIRGSGQDYCTRSTFSLGL